MAAAAAKIALAVKQRQQKKLKALQSAKNSTENLSEEQRDNMLKLLSDNPKTLFIANLAKGKSPDAPKEVETGGVEEVWDDWDGTVAWDDYEKTLPVVRPHFLSRAHYLRIVKLAKGQPFDPAQWFDKYLKHAPPSDDPRARKLALSVQAALAEDDASAESAESRRNSSFSDVVQDVSSQVVALDQTGARRSVVVKFPFGAAGDGEGEGASRSRSIALTDGLDALGPLDDAPSWVWHYNYFVFINQSIAAHVAFNALVVGCIVVAGILVGVQSYPAMDGDPALAAIDATVQIIFTFECVFKIFAEGRKPWVYWSGPERSWNNFDFWLVFIVWLPLDGGNVAFLRLLRLMRLLKLVGKVKQLQVIVMGLVKGLSSVSYIMVLMMLIFYLFAVAGVDTFRENDPFHFGSLGIAMLSLFRCATLEDWSDIMYINIFGCDAQYGGVAGVYGGLDNAVPPYEHLGTRQKGMGTLAGYFPANECWNPVRQPLVATAFFILFILIAAFVMLSLFVGAVCGGMSEALEGFKEAQAAEEAKAAAEGDNGDDDKGGGKGGGGAAYSEDALRQAFEQCDEDGSGEIDAEELVEAMSDMGEDGVTLEVATQIIRRLDDDGNGTLGFSEFFKLMTGQALTEQQQEDRNLLMKLSATNPVEAAAVQAKQVAAAKVFHESLQLIAKIKRAWRSEKQELMNFDHIKSPYWKAYLTLSERAGWVVNDPKFVNMVTVAIIAAGVVVGFQTELNVPCHAQPTQPKDGPCVEEPQPVLDALDTVILAIFTVEVVGKLLAAGLAPHKYFHDSWNCFDFFIVAACFAFMLPFMPDAGGMLAMLRLLRLLRVLKLVKALPELRIIIEALISGFGSISFVTIILFMFFYLFANVGMIFFGGNDPMHFGNLQLSLVSLFRAATLDDWTDIMYINMFGCDVYGYEFGKKSLGFSEQSLEGDHANCNDPRALGWVAALFMVTFVIIGSMVLLTLFIGIVATAMEEAKLAQRDEAKRELKALARCQTLGIAPGPPLALYRAVFDDLDGKKEGRLDKEDLKPLVDALPLLQAQDSAFKSYRDPSIHGEEEAEEAAPQVVKKASSFVSSASFSSEATNMTRKDMERLVSLVDVSQNGGGGGSSLSSGGIELGEFLVLMDFMRRVRDDGTVLQRFRGHFQEIQAVERAKRRSERFSKRQVLLQKKAADAADSTSAFHAASAQVPAQALNKSNNCADPNDLPLFFSPLTPGSPTARKGRNSVSLVVSSLEEEEEDDEEDEDGNGHCHQRLSTEIKVWAPSMAQHGRGGKQGNSSLAHGQPNKAASSSQLVQGLEAECAALREAIEQHSLNLLRRRRHEERADEQRRQQNEHGPSSSPSPLLLGNVG
eukprot:CAMPEP_0171912944 /NCGR_PEP_ID=MMETSP0993-20121228/11445_1 /TAXON_ID=483369 /ORGANISM="non described non described, Strain CCMP2098" /LENGTH=1353 /DNA_ID=CAMNT_0012546867 /DNA_START=112 /DNA_END=4169 /DNA_ORIENTATION=-